MSIKLSRVAKILNLLQPVDAPYERIRIGGDSDGGYILPDDLSGVTECLSLGFGGISKFEEALAGKGISSHIFDNLNNPINKGASDSDLIRFHHGYIGSPRVDTMPIFSIKDAIENAGLTSEEIILQMDIESSEYISLLQIDNQTLKRFRIIIVEFHRLNELSASSIFLSHFEQILHKLNDHFVPFHIHGNNAVRQFKIDRLLFPSAIEVTFLRRNRPGLAKYAYKKGSVKHPLDRPCNPIKKEIEIFFPIGQRNSSRIEFMRWYFNQGILWIRSHFDSLR